MAKFVKKKKTSSKYVQYIKSFTQEKINANEELLACSEIERNESCEQSSGLGEPDEISFQVSKNLRMNSLSLFVLIIKSYDDRFTAMHRYEIEINQGLPLKKSLYYIIYILLNIFFTEDDQW